MNHAEGLPKFQVRPLIEQRPFENPSTQTFFSEWCKINDSLKLQFVEREVTGRQLKPYLLEDSADGSKVLSIPQNLPLWEMVGVMEAIDQDTCTHNPIKTEQAKVKMQALGKTFTNAAIYLAKRLVGIAVGKEIAEALAIEFYQYGQSLAKGEFPTETPEITDIANQPLTSQETETIDHFLAGDKLYASRMARVKDRVNLKETDQIESDEKQRQITLTQFFRVAEKAFTLTNFKTTTPIHQAFLTRINNAMKRELERPKQELGSTIFRRGMEFLQHQMPFDRLPRVVKSTFLGWENQVTTLREALKIETLKTELDALRKNGDLAQIVSKECEIADRIQLAVASYPYQEETNNPQAIVDSQQLNCLGASMLGGALMQKAGLNYLVGDLPDHSFLLLITSDGQVEIRDFLETDFCEALTNDKIDGQNDNKKSLEIADIVRFSQSPNPKGLRFRIRARIEDNDLWKLTKGSRKFITVFEPELGQQIQLLTNIAGMMSSSGRYEEAVEAANLALGLNPDSPQAHHNLGNALFCLGERQKAIEAFKRAISLDENLCEPYSSLGHVFLSLSRREEAIEAYEKFLNLADETIDPKFIIHIGRILKKLQEHRQK